MVLEAVEGEEEMSDLSGLSDKEKLKIDVLEIFQIIGLIILITIIYAVRIHFFLWFTRTKIADFIFGILLWGLPILLTIKLIFWTVRKFKRK